MTDIRQLLMEANPVPRVDVPDALRAELFAEVRRTPPPPARRARRWQWPLPTVLLALVVAGGAATAGGLIISKLTRDQSAALTRAPALSGGSGSPTSYGAQVRVLAERVVATTPYPPGVRETYDWERYGAGSGAPGELSGSVEAFVQFRAQCMWREFWLRSVASGDTQAVREATVVLAQIPEWSAMRGVGRNGQARARAQRVATAAARKDVDTVTALTRGDCRDQP